MKTIPIVLATVILGAGVLSQGNAAPVDFEKEIRPILDTYCFSCHDDQAKGGINLEANVEDSAFWSEPKEWEKAMSQLRDRSMPPAKKDQPTDEERAKVLAWLADKLENPDLSKVPRDPGRTVIHRLSRLEYNLTVRDLLGVDTKPADNFPPDGGGGGGFDNNASTLFVPPILMEKYLAAANDIVAAAKPDRLFHVFPHDGKDEPTAAKENLEWLGMRAYRRPIQADELSGLLSLYQLARDAGESWDNGIRLAVRAILVSPSFLFRIEDERPEFDSYRISDVELASRLSYFLWSSMPDEKLFNAALAGKLADPAILAGEIRRMLADPKSRILAENFATQWLRTKELKTGITPATDKFPQFTSAMREAMIMESVEFFHALLRDDRPVTECLEADYVYVNELLAKHYGLPGVEGDHFRKVWVEDNIRGGIATMGAVLTLTSYPRRTSPVMRGKWIMEEILGTPPPAAPPIIKALPTTDKVSSAGLSFRQQLEQHRSKAECAGCHVRMDQLGFGLENFDPIGAWRTEAGGAPVDSRGQLPTGEAFTGPNDLKSVLMLQKDEFVRNLTEKLLAYALGRGIENADWITVRNIAKSVAAENYSTQKLIFEITNSLPFQYRKPLATPKSASAEP